MSTIFIYGAGGFGREVLELVQAINSKTFEWNKFFFIDDFYSNRKVHDILVVDSSFYFDFVTRHPESSIIIASGHPRSRIKMLENLKGRNVNVKLATLVSPHARVSKRARIGLGTIVCAGAHISVDVGIGENCIINNNSIIGHDVEIGNEVVISSQVDLGGNVKIMNEAFVGMGSIVREGINIGERALVGMGSVVTSDVPSEILVIGNPARPTRRAEGISLYNNQN